MSTPEPPAAESSAAVSSAADPVASPRVVLVVLAGGADPLDVHTPLSDAETPALDRIARDGTIGRLALGAATCWDGFTGLVGAAPGTLPMGPCDAAGASVDLADGEWVARLDLVTMDDAGMLDPFGGRVRDAEADLLVSLITGHAQGGRIVRLARNRNLLVLPAASPSAGPSAAPSPPPPWQMLGRDPQAELRDPLLRELFEHSRAALSAHDVNAVRLDLGENPANAVWPHGGGHAVVPVASPDWAAGRAALVAAGGASIGLARALGFDHVDADGSDDELGAAALAALATHDVVVVRTEAALAPAVARDADGRREALSAIDARVISPLLSALEERGPFVLAVASDGVVDSASSAFSAEPVPYGLLRSGLSGACAAGAGASAFSERACEDASHRLESSDAFAALLARARDAISPPSLPAS